MSDNLTKNETTSQEEPKLESIVDIPIDVTRLLDKDNNNTYKYKIVTGSLVLLSLAVLTGMILAIYYSLEDSSDPVSCITCIAGTNFSNLTCPTYCNPCFVCESGYIEAEACSITSDRVCIPFLE